MCTLHHATHAIERRVPFDADRAARAALSGLPTSGGRLCTLSAPSAHSGEDRRFAFVELRVGASAHVELRVIPVPPRVQAAHACGGGGTPPPAVGPRGEPVPGARDEVFWTDEG